ncbi:hypothetical protein EU537_10330 [Candidatus Thorarchaeota archaeon]|nr:MAG: hypothetical protein EU537_10330 [Candidatus Thorarchaeota archaeon]
MVCQMASSTASFSFIHVFPRIPAKPKFHLKDLPGSGKRIDILCRGLAACFDWAPELISRTNIEYYAVLSDKITMKFTYSPECIGKGETWWASVIQRVLSGVNVDFCGKMDWNLETTMKSTTQDNFDLYVLDEKGTPIDTVLQHSNLSQNSFMVGDHRGFELDTRELLRDMNVQQVSLGETSYLGSHCIAQVISNYERISKS